MIGRALGPYEIVAKLGQGGMGEVWKARDTRLDRFVALKMSAARFSDRFEREARAIAALNHPNICTLHDVGPNYLVMELVEGDTLAELIARQASAAGSTARALASARQMAEALEAAHEKGIVHRDLKPANIKITPDGNVKILDFGLATALAIDRDTDGPAAAADPANSPTLTSPAMTEFGMILGTAAYMSPEQARGRPVDKRTDIWAFGVVLFEMLTGRPLFQGETVSDTMAAVIKDDVRWDRLPPDVPRSVRRLIARCLERDPKQRLRDIGEARIALTPPWEQDAESVGARPAAGRARGRLTTVAAVVVTLAGLAAAAAWYTRPSSDAPLRRFVLADPFGPGESFALSPDGSKVAYFLEGQLYVRALDALEARNLGPVHVTSNRPFWSPDGHTIGFTARGKLLKIPEAGGSVIEVCAVPATGNVLDAAWRQDDTIVFAVWRDSVYSVPASGGTPTVLLAVNGAAEVDFHSLDALPDHRLIVATHLRSDAPAYQLEVIDGTPKGGRAVILSERDVDAGRYDGRGHVLFRRFGANAGLWAVPFADGPLDTSQATLVQAGATAFQSAVDGTVLVRLPPAGALAELIWVDRQGVVTKAAGAPFAPSTRGGSVASGPRLSRDGRRVAFFVASGSGSYLVVRDLQTGADLRITHDEASPAAIRPMPLTPSWSPAGDDVLFTIGTVEAQALVARRTDGSARERPLVAGRSAHISPDGRFLVFTVDDRGVRHLRYAPIGADGSIGAAAPLFRDADPNVSTFDVSPDGGFLAYGAIERDGRINLFLTTFPGAGERWQVTSEGGAYPRFAPDGTELLFLSGVREAGRTRGWLAAMPMVLRPRVKFGVPVVLFEEGLASVDTLATFDVAPDGRFLMLRAVASDTSAARHVLIQNWRAAIPTR